MSQEPGLRLSPAVLEWLLFVPQLPSLPSSLRVQVWRRMRAAGATTLQQSVWVLPRTEAHERFLHEMLAEVTRQGGSAVVLAASLLGNGSGPDVAARFRADRDQEYQEFWGRCRDFLKEIEKETAAGNLSFAELEENEEDLVKLEGWLKKIQDRDFFGAPAGEAAAAALDACQTALKGFAEAIYAREGLEGPGGSARDRSE